ncbi:bifunctional adenosylcobinamide kinase/adenosylcobinamide-phosphate guanylyltransferase [Marinomonas pollencensis]|uniref:Bifunctional adenosylcobalamin biosynthesis protein n=1 Tax=Marinomonas pollencensis TaxID=491954 RepID=A0A3E0DA17_9GAMM|nr:bifunctional adenosylcobinamide kinase/adenosylcobinamide-phosphate guanylyltransferase [Marinomonas pollencensis]REG79520.1 adenosylcobinamide kinase /adenosylcobinamide-phosphate guanylyltransferase [Marinomonas pollencensis]
MKHLVLGGVRSGKSAFAEKQVLATGLAVHYIATSQVWDEEMASRVAKHQQGRPAEWQLIEEPLALADTLARLNDKENVLIIECVSLWISNLLCLEDEARLVAETNAFLKAVDAFQGSLVIVSSEVGLGIMPINKLARRFGDEIGTMNQKLANLTERVTFVAAGLPMPLKSPP